MGSRFFFATFFVSLCAVSTAFGSVLSAERVEVARGRVPRQVLGMGDSKDEWCDRIDFVDKTVSCASTAKLYYGSAKKPITTAKTTSADYTVKISTSGRASGITRTCTEILAGDWVLDQLINSGACSAATQKTNGGTIMTNVKKLLNGAQNRNYIQKTRLETIKNSLESDTIDIPKLKKSIIDSLVVIDYFEKTQQSVTTLASQVDKMVLSGVGVSPGVSSAWSKKMAKIKTVKTTLLAQLQKDIQQKQKQAKEAQSRKNQCGTSTTGTSTGKTTPKTSTGKAVRMERRHLTSVAPETSLELATRLQTAARSGPNAPAAPSCPAKSGQGTKKVVPRSKTSTKTAPAKTPRTPSKRPKAKAANPKKKVVKRPASRPRRTPGKVAPKRRTTPKKKPKVVPKPARKPKGKARSRRRR